MMEIQIKRERERKKRINNKQNSGIIPVLNTTVSDKQQHYHKYQKKSGE